DGGGTQRRRGHAIELAEEGPDGGALGGDNDDVGHAEYSVKRNMRGLAALQPFIMMVRARQPQTSGGSSRHGGAGHGQGPRGDNRMYEKRDALRHGAMALAIAMALGLSGCGGGSNVKPSTPPPPATAPPPAPA